MASNYRINKPYVLAGLPRSLEGETQRYTVGEVYGQRPGSRKRKRAELVVGTDGDSAALYDVGSGRLITSSPIPPEDRFTCPPYSIRLRSPPSKEVRRYTYVSTTQGKRHTVTLFKDVVDDAGKTTSTATSHALSSRSPVIRLWTECVQDRSNTPSNPGPGPHALFMVCDNGDVTSLDGESLEERWTESSGSAFQAMLPKKNESFSVQFASPVSSSDFIRDTLPWKRAGSMQTTQVSTPSTVGSDAIALVANSVASGPEVYHLAVLRVDLSHATAGSGPRKLQVLYGAPIPPADNGDAGQGAGHATYRIDPGTRQLLELHQDVLRIFELSDSVLKLRHTMELPSASSVLRLSQQSVVSTTPTSIDIVNPVYHSISATTEIKRIKSGGDPTWSLIDHFRRLNIVVALGGSELLAAQLQPPQTRGRKRTAEGLLIDAIGRGNYSEPFIPRRPKSIPHSTTFASLLPGTLTETYSEKLQKHMSHADKLLYSGDFAGFEKFLSERFKVQVDERKQIPNGTVHPAGECEAEQEEDTPEWTWLGNRSNYASVDRRWVHYAISRVFTFETTDSDAASRKLALELPSSNVLIYLIVAGHLTLPSIRAAFKHEIPAEEAASNTIDLAIIEGLIQAVVDVDPTMELLVTYLTSTRLGEKELLVIIRTFLQSLDMLRDSVSESRLLENGTAGDDEDADVAMQLAVLEQELQTAELYLGDDSNSQARGLTMACAMLTKYPPLSTSQALRTTFEPPDIVSLIYLLRTELVRGAWTTRYFDTTNTQDEGAEAASDGALSLIADLLSRCVDAVGVSGWLLSDAISGAMQTEPGEFLAALKLEVSAALEGLEDALYLNGVLCEAIRYGAARQQLLAVKRQGRGSDKPVTLTAEAGADAERLPLGLRAKQLPTKEKVVSGGEVKERSMREMGHLISQKVEAYTLERVVI